MNQQLNENCHKLQTKVVLHLTNDNQVQKQPKPYLDFNQKIEQKAREKITKISLENRQLFDKNRELKKVNQQLESFAYTVSHDLQEPLRSINLFAQLLEEEYTEKLDEQAQEYIEFITSGANRMQTLIRDILAYSRAGTNEDTWVNVDLNQSLEVIILDLQNIIQQTQAEIIIEHLPTILVNPTEINQLLYNLITNSLKFRGNQKPQIKISSKKQANQWLIAVEDNGIGIEAEYQKQIFQAFARVHSQNRYPGSGVGLAICQKIVERYRGKIWVESQPGKGSNFYFTFPHIDCYNPIELGKTS